MKSLTSTFLFLITLASMTYTSASFAASSYKWTDDKGNVHYSQHPPRDRESERLKIKSPRSSKTYQAPASSTTQSSEANSQPDSNSKGGIAEQLSKDNAALRKKNCENAKENLRVYQVHRRVRDTEGKVQRLSQQEREKRIAETKEQISEFCD